MTKLSYLRDMINIYLALHGDKSVTSISSCGGSGNENDYIIHLHDIYEGPVGHDPYTGEDSISIAKNGSISIAKDGHLNGEETAREEMPEPKPVVMTAEEYKKRLKAAGVSSWQYLTRDIKAYLDMEKEISESDKPTKTKILMVWGALTLLQGAGELNELNANALFQNFVFHELGLEGRPE